jgi:putative oxidoreductase
MDVGLLIARLVLGPLMAAHGAQKLFGWFGGYGIAGTGGFLEAIGFRPGRFFAAVAGLIEFVSGLLIAFGFLGPIGPALLVSVMIVAAVSVHWEHGLFAAQNGIEVPLLYATAGTALTMTGPGRYSLDAAFSLLPLWASTINWLALGIGLLGAVANLAARKTAPAASHATA